MRKLLTRSLPHVRLSIKHEKREMVSAVSGWLSGISQKSDWIFTSPRMGPCAWDLVHFITAGQSWLLGGCVCLSKRTFVLCLMLNILRCQCSSFWLRTPALLFPSCRGYPLPSFWKQFPDARSETMKSFFSQMTQTYKQLKWVTDLWAANEPNVTD